MPYGLTGVYTLPPIYLAIPGTVIISAQHNIPLEDLATANNYPRPIVAGGTGATSAAGALNAIGAAPRAKVVEKNGDFTIESGNNNYTFNVISEAVATLPPSSSISSGWGVWVIARNAAVTIATSSSVDKINGASTLLLPEGSMAEIMQAGETIFIAQVIPISTDFDSIWGGPPLSVEHGGTGGTTPKEARVGIQAEAYHKYVNPASATNLTEVDSNTWFQANTNLDIILPDVSTLAEGWAIRVQATGATVSLKRQSPSDTINSSTSDFAIPSSNMADIVFTGGRNFTAALINVGGSLGVVWSGGVFEIGDIDVYFANAYVQAPQNAVLVGLRSFYEQQKVRLSAVYLRT